MVNEAFGSGFESAPGHHFFFLVTQYVVRSFALTIGRHGSSLLRPVIKTCSLRARILAAGTKLGTEL